MGVNCIHCGEDCGKHPVLLDDKPFCCHGCKTVYQILNTKEMGQYYRIRPMSGIRIEQTETGNKYAYLELEEIREKLLDFSDGGFSKVSLFIPGIHCASCIWLLENLNTLNPGIIQSAVNFPDKTVSITFKDEQISLRQLVELLASIHYIPEITLDKLDKKESQRSDRNVLLKIGIAAFSFMNVMLYNFPEYLPGGEELGGFFTRVFGWLSLLLSLPVVFYSASDYYLSAFKGLKHRMINIDLPITLGIFTLFFQSAYEIISGHGIGYMDSLTGLVFFLLIGKWYQGKTYQALSFERDYKSYFPVAVTTLVDDNEQTIPLSKLKKGHHILIRNQELIPADSRLVKGNANIDYSFVTGESLPVPKNMNDFIFAGGRQVGSTIELVVEKEVEQSYLTQLWNQDSNKQQSESGLNTLVNKVSESFTVAILFVAFSAGVYWLLNDSSLALFAFTSVLIIACPCALALTVPFTFGSTMRAFGRSGFYIKNSEVIENLQKIDTVVFDKTGTITLNRSLKARFVGEPLTRDELCMIKSLAASSGHPLSTAVKENIDCEGLLEVEDFQEIPAMGTSALICGKRVSMGSKKFITGKADESSGSTAVYVFIENRVAGYFQIENTYRDGLAEIVNRLQKKYELYLLSGDNASEKKNLSVIFGSGKNLFFNQSPSDKMGFVKKLKENARKVLMIGDGLNDAGALLESDVGLTIADDIYSFSPACNGIVEAGKFDRLYDFLDFSHLAMKVVKLSFAISFLYNIIGLFFAVQGTLSPIIAAILMPVSSVSVVAFATFSVHYLSTRKIS
ncbi:MAG: heavy metal translocating P-type ATPase metal-binding domain-containing protein [Bacteroidales bacterium]|nr:heavy metal translocating P-type ATPase metal-binding domain-containing protein [Bacteroidales bacterium]